MSGKRSETIGYQQQLTGRLLTNEEEQILDNWIVVSYKRALPVTKSKVLGALDDILLKEQELMYIRNIQNVSSTHESWWKA